MWWPVEEATSWQARRIRSFPSLDGIGPHPSISPSASPKYWTIYWKKNHYSSSSQQTKKKFFVSFSKKKYNQIGSTSWWQGDRNCPTPAAVIGLQGTTCVKTLYLFPSRALVADLSPSLSTHVMTRESQLNRRPHIAPLSPTKKEKKRGNDETREEWTFWPYITYKNDPPPHPGCSCKKRREIPDGVSKYIYCHSRTEYYSASLVCLGNIYSTVVLFIYIKEICTTSERYYDDMVIWIMLFSVQKRKLAYKNIK